MWMYPLFLPTHEALHFLLHLSCQTSQEVLVDSCFLFHPNWETMASSSGESQDIEPTSNRVSISRFFVLFSETVYHHSNKIRNYSNPSFLLQWSATTPTWCRNIIPASGLTDNTSAAPRQLKWPWAARFWEARVEVRIHFGSFLNLSFLVVCIC